MLHCKYIMLSFVISLAEGQGTGCESGGFLCESGAALESEGSGDVDLPADVNQVVVAPQALSTVTVVGCILSMVGLLSTAVTYLYFWRLVKSIRALLLINLCAVLFIAYLIFLIGIHRTENMTSCTAVAVLLHYVYLVVFFVMLAKGGVITLMVLRPLGKKNVPIFLAATYGIPLIIVAISMGATRLIGYGNERFCWLTMESGLFWAFAGPVLTIVATNTIIMVLVLKQLFGVSAMAKRTDVEQIKTGVRSMCVLLPVLGFTCLFGLFAVHRDKLVFQHLFAICNILQGFLTFLVHCVFDRKIRDAVRETRIPWLTRTAEMRTGATEMNTYSMKACAGNTKET
ncbi:adhesion G protein-coupled receptor B2-like [Dreissena polymorpha]|uniref:adhesion G protein-coupled receptor B2-like n=1 Tax=Dreissena polymorpha TaxID=45954 RepID=UPI002264C50E|nr:adhesion G protein-coupled receptor B2-like [Dreissena polymorpha]